MKTLKKQAQDTVATQDNKMSIDKIAQHRKNPVECVSIGSLDDRKER